MKFDLASAIREIPVVAVSNDSAFGDMVKQNAGDRFMTAAPHGVDNAIAYIFGRERVILVIDSKLSLIDRKAVADALSFCEHTAVLLLNHDAPVDENDCMLSTVIFYQMALPIDERNFQSMLMTLMSSLLLVPVADELENQENRVTDSEIQLLMQNRLLNAISTTQETFIEGDNPRKAFDFFLYGLLELTESEYGFIGEVLTSTEGNPYLKTYALTNIAWTPKLVQFYEEKAPEGLEFHNLNTLFGATLSSGELVIANDPKNDSRAGGLPHGHPPLNAFMGIPLYHGTRFIGMAGIANRPNGYDMELYGFLQPYMKVCSLLIDAYQREQRRKEALVEQERTMQKLQSILNNMIDSVIMIDRDGTVVEYNPAAERMFLYHRDEVIGKNIKLLMPEPYHSEHDGYLSRYHATQEAHIIGKGREVVGQRKNGQVFFLELAVSEMRNGDDIFFVGTLHDLTERKRHQQELQESEQRFRTLAEAAFEAIVIHNNGTIIEANKAATELFQYRYDELIQSNIFDLIQDSQKHIVAQKTLRLSEEPYETTCVRKDGTFFDVEVQARYVPYQGGMFRVAAIRDISERKKIERLKNEFVSTVSHELRTPLTSILGSLGLIVGGALGELPEKARNMIDIAHKNSQRLVLLINDLLDIQRIESGKMAFTFGKVGITVLIDTALKGIEAYAKQFDITVEPEIPAIDISVYGDSNRLIQVLNNFLSNAIKFSPKGETVTLRVQQKNDTVRISVIDNGPGIPDEFRKTIFQRFAQADSSATRKSGGTGLGLSIAKAIVEKHGGNVGFDSVLGGGSTFWFDLKVYQQREERTAQTQSTHRILLCDYEPDHSIIAQQALEPLGLALDIAYSADEALRFLVEHNYLLIITDASLKDSGGKPFLASLPEVCPTPPPVLLYGTDSYSFEMSDKLTIVDFLHKPVEPRYLFSAVMRAAKVAGVHVPVILHVEDDPDNRIIVQQALSGFAHIVPAVNLAQGVELLAQQHFDLIILDIGLPDAPGTDLLGNLARTGKKHIPVILYTALDIAATMQGSVAKVLVKSKSTTADLVNAVHELLDGTTRHPQEKPHE